MDKELCEKLLQNQDEKIDKLDTRVTSLEKTYAVMQKLDYRMGQVENSVNNIDKRLETFSQNKSAKWDKLVDYLFYAFVAYALLKLGIK